MMSKRKSLAEEMREQARREFLQRENRRGQRATEQDITNRLLAAAAIRHDAAVKGWATRRAKKARP